MSKILYLYRLSIKVNTCYLECGGSYNVHNEFIIAAYNEHEVKQLYKEKSDEVLSFGKYKIECIGTSNAERPCIVLSIYSEQ